MKGAKDVRVWVPGETCDDGILILDESTGEELLVTQGERGFLFIPGKGGKMTRRHAVRATLINKSSGTERYALAKLANGHTIGVRIVAGWQLGSGDGKPPAADVVSEAAP